MPAVTETIFTTALTKRQPLAVRLLDAQLCQGRLSRAYLFTGRATEDKMLLARHMASALNCQARSHEASKFCLTNQVDQALWCANCRWIDRDEHPQAWITLASDQTKSGKLPVEKARALSEELSLTSRFYRTVVVKDASLESFHRPAANALLKIMEEPKSNVVFFLFAQAQSDVLKTVVSRCQNLQLFNPDLAAGHGHAQIEGKKPQQEACQAKLGPLLSEINSLTKKRAHVFSLAIAQAMEDLVNEEILLPDIIEFIVGSEIGKLRKNLSTQVSSLRYCAALMQAADLAKTQNRHYVSQKAVIDAFAFHWTEVATEGNLATRPETVVVRRVGS
jgi:hypothetical protein